MKKENEKRRKLLKKEEIINNFFKTMTIKNFLLIISVVITKKDLGLYSIVYYTILLIIIDYAITILRFKEIYKKILNGIIIFLLLINLGIELLMGLNNLYICILILLIISTKYISCLEIYLFEKAKKEC